MQLYCSPIQTASIRLTERGCITYCFIVHHFFLANTKPESFAVLGEPSHSWGGSDCKRQSDLKFEALKFCITFQIKINKWQISKETRTSREEAQLSTCEPLATCFQLAFNVAGRLSPTPISRARIWPLGFLSQGIKNGEVGCLHLHLKNVDCQGLREENE